MTTETKKTDLMQTLLDMKNKPRRLCDITKLYCDMPACNQPDQYIPCIREANMPASGLSFVDMHGNAVTVGDKIRIVSNYNYPHLNGQICDVVWNAQQGQYNYQYDDVRTKSVFTHTDDFYGIHEFEKITDATDWLLKKE